MSVQVVDEAGKTKRQKPSAVPVAQLLDHIRSVSVARHAARFRDGRADLPGFAAADATNFEDVTDDVTLQQLKEIRCATHKLEPIRGHRQAKKKRATMRSGGFLVACTPSGFAVDGFDFMGSESCSQRYIFLARLKALYPNFHVCFGDDNCHLRRFAEKRLIDGS